MPYTTLSYSGTEKRLSDWGITQENCSLKLVANEHGRTDVFQAAVPMADCFADPLFAFEAGVIVRSARVSADGTPGSFSGGVVEFTGKRLLHVIDGRPDFEGVYYRFGGPGY